MSSSGEIDWERDFLKGSADVEVYWKHVVVPRLGSLTRVPDPKEVVRLQKALLRLRDGFERAQSFQSFTEPEQARQLLAQQQFMSFLGVQDDG